MIAAAGLLLGSVIALSTVPRDASAAPVSDDVSRGQSARGYSVGVLVWSDTIPGQVAMRKGLEAEATRINAAALGDPAGRLKPVRITIAVAGDGDDGIERQIAQMYAMVRSGVDAIVVQPTDNAALAAPLRAANAAKIPVIAYDQYIEGGRLEAFVTSDNYQAGVLGGEYISARFPNTQAIKLVLIDYSNVSSTVERVNGFMDTLAERGQRFKVLANYRAVEPASGARAGARLLREFPAKGSVDVVFTVNDGGGLSVVEALAKAGRDEILVATVDGDPASVDNIKRGRLTAIDAAQFCGPMGASAMNLAYRHLQGETIPAQQLLPTFPITRETLKTYPGWMGPLPGAFTKPWPSKTPQWRPEPRLPLRRAP